MSKLPKYQQNWVHKPTAFVVYNNQTKNVFGLFVRYDGNSIIWRKHDELKERKASRKTNTVAGHFGPIDRLWS